MSQVLLQKRKLTIEDRRIVEQMQTNIEDDYILKIYPDLVQSEKNALYGLFEGENLVAFAGYTLFPGGYAMLGRLRSDTRLLSKGHATEILGFAKNQAEKDPNIKWVGANTNVSNKPARRVIEKIGLSQTTTTHSLIVKVQTKINGTSGNVWREVTSLDEKRSLLDELALKKEIIYPYECYYPFPFTQQLLTDEELNDSSFFKCPDNNRFMIIKNDQKRDWFAHVKYFWNDYFKQPGFWETVYDYVSKDKQMDLQIWVDFSEEAYHNIPNKLAFDDSDPWVLYGKWV